MQKGVQWFFGETKRPNRYLLGWNQELFSSPTAEGQDASFCSCSKFKIFFFASIIICRDKLCNINETEYYRNWQMKAWRSLFTKKKILLHWTNVLIIPDSSDTCHRTIPIYDWYLQTQICSFTDLSCCLYPGA